VTVGFEWTGTDALLEKVDEELAELRAELTVETPDRERISSELGDLLFTLVNVARRTGVDPDEALRQQIVRFGKRFRFIERNAAQQQRALPSLTADEWLTLWRAAKEDEKIQ
jgi:ATP diphosphatase